MPLKLKLIDALQVFAKAKNFRSKGALCVALVVTQKARVQLPLNAENLLAKSRTQVEGLGKGAVQSVLARHGINRVLAEEGGRTSRGSVANMRLYVDFLNRLPRPVNLDAIELFWVECVRTFFAGKPFKFRVDASMALRAAVRDLMNQARSRQAEFPGSRYEGTLLQHLVGAKLTLVLPDEGLTHHSASEADQAEGRAGDFVVGDVAIHTTTHPGEALIRKCAANLAAGLRPMIITVPRQTTVAETLAESAEISDRIDVLDIEQFLAANLHERGLFQPKGRNARTLELVEIYNRLIEKHETDPSLKITVAGS